MQLNKLIKTYNNFPHKGIKFKDINRILSNKLAYRYAINELSKLCSSADYICGIESRGFMLACPLAIKLNLGFIPIRKIGKLPGKTLNQSCHLEYGNTCLEMQKGIIKKGKRVVIVDDILATGGTAEAAASLIYKARGIVSGLLFLVEIDFLYGRRKLSNYKVNSLIKL